MADTDLPDKISGEAPLPEKISNYDVAATAATKSAYLGMSPEEQADLRQVVTAPSSTDPILQGLNPREVAIRDSFSQKAQDEFDAAQEAQFVEAAKKYPPNIAMEARRYLIAKPHLDLDYIATHLAEVRAQVQAEGFNFEAARVDHPVLHKYLTDPATATQAMQASATLTGIDRVLGGTARPLGEPAPEPTTGETVENAFSLFFPVYGAARMARRAATEKNYVLPSYAQIAVDAFKNDVPALLASVPKMAADVMHDMFRTEYDDGTPIPLSKQPLAEQRELIHNYWTETHARLSRETTGAKDYLGPTPEGAWYTPQRLARSLEVGVGFVAQQGPLLLFSALSGGVGAASAEANIAGRSMLRLAPGAAGMAETATGRAVSGAAAAATREGFMAAQREIAFAHARGVFMLNTLYSAMDMYPKLADATESPGLAAALTLTGAPALGKVMGFTPTGSATGARMYKWVNSAVSRSAASALESESWRRLTFMAAAKTSADFLVGKAAFAAQGAAYASMEQFARGVAGKETDAGAILDAAVQGWHDGDAAALMSIYGSARHLVSGVGKVLRAKNMAERIDELKLRLETLDDSDPALHEQMVKETAAQPGRDKTFFLPLQRYIEVMQEAGYDPRAVAAEAHGDGGYAFDKAVREHAEHLPIPVEKMKPVFTSKVKGLADLAVMEGTLDPEVQSRLKAKQISDEFKAAYDAAVKVKPDQMSEGDKAMYEALLSFASADESAAQRMYAQVKALETQHGEFTTQELFDMTFGAGGLSGPPVDRQSKVRMGSGLYERQPSYDPITGLSNRHFIFSHDANPVKFHVEIKDVNGVKTWEGANFDFPTAEEKRIRESGKTPKELYGGTGQGDDIYLYALAKAQKAGVAWKSHEIRSDVTKDRYARLRTYGIPFEYVKSDPAIPGMWSDYYYLSPEALKALDFSSIHKRRAELLTPVLDRVLTAVGLKDAPPPLVDQRGKPYGMAAPAEQAVRIAVSESGAYNSKEWMGAFKTEQAAFDHAALIGDMMRLARERVEAALKAGLRSQTTAERKKFEAQAREEIKKDLAYRAQHFFETGELWGDARRRDMLIGQDGKPRRLLDKEVDSIMGPGAAEAIKAVKKNLITSDPAKSVDVDAAANALGFEGSAALSDPARRLLTGLRDALSEGQFVKQWAEMKTQEALRSEPLDSPQAMALRITDGVQNEKMALVLIARLRAMGDALDPMRQGRSKLGNEAWATIADNIVQSKALGDLRPEQYIRAMKTASDRALEALRKGDTAKAWDATEAQLLNHYMYRRAREAEKSLSSARAKLAEHAASDSWRAELGKADPAYRAVVDGLMGAVGIGDATPTAGLMDALKQRIADNAQDVSFAADVPGGWDSKVVGSILEGDRKWEDLTTSEAYEVFKAIKNIRHVAKVQNESLKAARAAQVHDLILGAARHLSGLAPGVEGPALKGHNPIPQDTSVEANRLIKSWKKMAAVFGWGGAYLDSPRVILGYLGDVLQDRVYGGFMDSRIKESVLLKELYEPWKETQKIWENDPEFHRPLVGLEEWRLVHQGYDENGKEIWGQVPGLRIHGLDGPLTKKYLIQMLKWTGSESGRQKLLDGMGVSIDAVLDAAGRYLEPHELEAIQAEHRFFEEKLAPHKAEAHERRTGLPWEKVVAMPYEIKFARGPGGGEGQTVTYAGGYYPVHWDKREGVDRQYIPVEPDKENKFNPKVPDGSFKERTKFVGVPDLNWANVPAHLLSDVHNLSFGDFVQDANRILLNPQMLGIMRRHLGDEYANWPRAWLGRVANESSGHMSGHLAGINGALRYSRSALTYGALGLNLPLMAGDMAHPLATAVMRDGLAMSVTYAAPSMTRVLESYANEAISGVNDLHLDISTKSAVVRLRADELPSLMSRWFTGTYEQSAEPGFFKSASRVRDAINNTAFWHLRLSDRMVTDMIWDAKYRKVLDETGDEMAARKAGDDQVLAAMPDYSVMATPSILAEKNSFAAVGLIFHYYWSKLLEMTDEQRHKMVIQPSRYDPNKVTKAMNAAQWAGRTLSLLTVAVVGGDFLQGQGKQDDEDWATWFKRRELAAPLQLFPYAGKLFGGGVEAWAHPGSKLQKIDIAMPHFAVPIRAINAIQSAMFDHQKMDEDKVFDLVNAGLQMGGLPANAPTRAARYAYEMAFNREEPRGGYDLASGLAYGKRFGRASRYNRTTPLTLIQTIFDERK